jgi:hypothetical protein
MVYIRPIRSLRGALATKQSQNEIATPFGLAMTPFCSSKCNLFYALCNKSMLMESNYVNLSLLGTLTGFLLSFEDRSPLLHKSAHGFL